MKPYTNCPYCTATLSLNAESQLSCTCGFIHYDNPIPVVACLVPFSPTVIDGKPETYFVPNTSPEQTRILLVQRGAAPFVGEWCLPCGYLNSKETPKLGAVRETKEETGIVTRVEKILGVCNPLPHQLNQIVICYLSRPADGYIRGGDDALEAKLFGCDELPPICFSSHEYAIRKWFKGEYGTLTGVDLT